VTGKNTMAFQSEHIYQAVWRWHFYAGLFVMPFLLILSLSGLLMLLAKPIEPLLHQALLEVVPQEQTLPASSLLSKVREQYPHYSVKLYIPPRENTESAQFSLQASSGGAHGGHNMPSTNVYMDPYKGDILGTLDPSQSFYSWIKNLHSSLFMGDLGDSLIEIAAGLAVLMIFSGIYLAWPKDDWSNLIPRLSLLTRENWRRWHRSIGMLIAIPLVFFLISGLAWTNIWGGKLVQPWNSLPGAFVKAPQETETLESMELETMKHESMNQEGIHHVPWAMEQTPMPKSAGVTGEFGIDKVNLVAAEQGFHHYRVHFPKDKNGVWTISAPTRAGDITAPQSERTLHLDRATGEALAEYKFADYPAMGMAMAAFIPLHQGDLGLWNWWLNVLIVIMVLMMIASGLILWWKRRPKNQANLGAPKAKPKLSKMVMIAMLLIALCFPLSALALLTIIIIDTVIISRVKSLQTVIK
jgi:uncharacterized iron-regulated membrane protein